jgi:hypothetical protein
MANRKYIKKTKKREAKSVKPISQPVLVAPRPVFRPTPDQDLARIYRESLYRALGSATDIIKAGHERGFVITFNVDAGKAILGDPNAATISINKLYN